MNQKQAMRRYMREFFLAMGIYVVFLLTSVTLLNKYDFARGWQIVISLAPALPVVFVMIAIMRLLVDSDELQQRVNLMATTFAAVLTGLITFSYGFLENVGFPKLPTFAIFPMLFVFWGIGLSYFRWRYE